MKNKFDFVSIEPIFNGKKKMKILQLRTVATLTLLTWHSLPAYALPLSPTSQIPETTPDEQFIADSQKTLPNLPRTLPENTGGKSEKIELTAKQFLAQPKLLHQTLFSALNLNDQKGVSLLYPLYQTLPQANPDLLLWSKAMLAWRERNMAQAIDDYRQLIAHQPRLVNARLQLAIILFQDQQNETSADQFEKLQAEKLSPSLKQLIAYYRNALQQRSQWQFDFGITYLADSNVNNAPKAGSQYKNWKSSEQPERADGVGYNLSLSKKFLLNQGFQWRIETDLQGKYYWNNHKYNELSLRFGTGLAYQNLKTEISLLPFVEKFLYAGGENARDNHLHSYTNSWGAELGLSHWLTPNWKVSSNIEYGKNHYPSRQDLNGHYYNLSNSLYFIPRSDYFFFVGADYYRKTTEKKSNQFDRKMLRLGWGQDWKWGISTRLSLNYAWRYYAEPILHKPIFFLPDFYQIRQKNKEYGVNLMLWHRALHWQGITPKLTWSYQKVKSNNPFASYDKNRIYLNFSKTF